MSGLTAENWVRLAIAAVLVGLVAWLLIRSVTVFRARAETLSTDEPADAGDTDADTDLAEPEAEPGAEPDADAQPQAAERPGPAHRADVEVDSSPERVPESGAFVAGPYAGSAEPLADGSAPAGYPVKGNVDSMLFHTVESPYYRGTRAQVWFDSEDHAREAGFTRWDER